MSDESNPDSLRKRVSELEEIVQSQQQTIAKMLPGRRGVLKGAGLLTGGALAGAAATERASAQAAGTVGTSNDPVNLNAWDLNVANQVTSDLPMGGNDLTNVGTADIETVANDSHYARSFDGADAEARLDSALTKATKGDIIYLENTNYGTARTISKENLGLIGSPNTRIDADTTFSGSGQLIQNVGFSGATVNISGSLVRLINANNGTGVTINISASAVILTVLDRGDVTFESGTSDGVINTSTRVTVTDNGTNVIGDTS